MHYASSILSHISNRLKLSRRTFLQNSVIESYLELMGSLARFHEWVWAKLILLVPSFDQGLQTEIAKHTHVASVNHFLYKLKELFLALNDPSLRITCTALPIKHHAVAVDAFNSLYKSFVQIFFRISIKSLTQIIYIARITCIYLYFSAFD